MAGILILGGGITGLTTAMLLAGDGHDVTVLERDPEPPPADGDAAWRAWERRGVNQFRMLHYFQPRFSRIMEAELPAVMDGLEAAGALEFNFVSIVPPAVTGGWREGDERLSALTGRRPVVERVLAELAAGTPGVTVRRGVTAAAITTGPAAVPGVPHVTGVRTEDGEEIAADLVLDATGRRSSLPQLLGEIGARPPYEEVEDCGFVYYGRHFRSPDGSTPPPLGSILMALGSISVLTLPADNGTWGIGVITSARDAALRPLKDVDRWMRAVKSLPLVAHWLDGEPLDDGVAVMAKIEDRYRSYVVDGAPVVTGFTAVGDAWACTNPSVGRGATFAAMHAVALRDTIRDAGLDDPASFVAAFADATAAEVEPWYSETLRGDRHRLAQVHASIDGMPFTAEGEAAIAERIRAAAGSDPDIFRAVVENGGVLARWDEIVERPSIQALLDSGAAADLPDPVAAGLAPDRDALVTLVAG